MTVALESIFPNLLLDGAARYAADIATGTPEAAIISEMGWNTILFAEDEGGYGGSLEDLAAVIEGTATRAINLPLITRCGIVPAILNALGDATSISKLRRGVAADELRIEWGGPCDAHAGQHVLPAIDLKQLTLNGTLHHTELAQDCTHLMFAVAVPHANEIALVLVKTDQLTGQRSAFLSVEGRNVHDISLGNLQLRDSDILAQADTALHALRAGWKAAQAATAADIVCTMRQALSETIAYLQERKQFGRPLSHFQVLQHDVAKLYVCFEACKGLLKSTLNASTEANLERSLAAFDLLGLYLREQAVEFAQSVIQLHGGMGMTQETLAARLATRLIALAFRFGDTYQHTRALQRYLGGQET